MLRTIELPQVGESVTEGVIGKWLVEPGQRVEKYDPLVEVVTDKVSMEAPSPYTGVFVRALAEEGETVPMGNPICEMEVEGEESPVVPAEAGTSQPDPVIPAQAGIQGAGAAHEAGSGDEGEELPANPVVPAEAGTSQPNPVIPAEAGIQDAAPEEAPAGEEDPARPGGAWAMPPAHDEEVPPVPEAQHAFEFMDSVRSVGPTGSGEGGEGRPDALQDEALAEHAEDGAHESAAESVAEPDRSHVISPLVARLSAQYGIDLSTLRGTGTGGRITSKDLLEAVNRMTSGAQEAEAGEHLSLEGRGRAESAGEGEPEEPQAVAEPAPEELAEPPLPEEEPEAEVIPTVETEAESASPVIPAQAATQELPEEPVVPAEAGTSQPAPDAEDESPLAEEEAEAEVIPAAEAEAEVTPEEEAVEDVEEALDEAEEEEAALGAVAVEPAPIPVEPASIPVIPAEAGTSQPAPEAPVDPLSLEGRGRAESAGEGEPAWEPEERAQVESEAAVAEDTSVMPLTPVRRIIAEHMARSSREIPAAWSMVEVDATRLVRTRDALKAAFEEKHGVPLTYLPFAAGAVAAALREHPRLNARWDDGHITLNNRVNLAVAVSTEAGLMVPVLHDADTLTIAAIAAELRRLSDGARAGTLGIEDVQGGTFTLNNTGALGSVVSVPIVNHPQAAIMTTEAIVKRPVVVEGDAIAVRSMMNLCITFDHRVCDGAEAAAFLSAVKARLEVIDESIGLG